MLPLLLTHLCIYSITKKEIFIIEKKMYERGEEEEEEGNPRQKKGGGLIKIKIFHSILPL